MNEVLNIILFGSEPTAGAIMPLLAAAAPLIGGAVGAIGAAGGSSLLGTVAKTGFEYFSQRQQQSNARKWEAGQIQRIAKDAKAAGIHPLAALGANVSYQNPYFGSGSGSVLGEGISNLADEYSQSVSRSEGRSLEKKQEQLLDEQILEARSRTILNQANAKRALVGPGAPNDPFATRTEPRFVRVCDHKTKKCAFVPNPDFEMGPIELATSQGLIEASLDAQNRPVHKPSIDLTKYRNTTTGYGG